MAARASCGWLLVRLVRSVGPRPSQAKTSANPLLGAALGSLLSLTASSALATPPGSGTHFDCSDTPGATSCAPDDSGCVPDAKNDPTAPGVVATLKCADALGKAFARAVRSVVRCHAKMAESVFNGAPSDDEACEDGTGAPRPGKSGK